MLQCMRLRNFGFPGRSRLEFGFTISSEDPSNDCPTTRLTLLEHASLGASFQIPNSCQTSRQHSAQPLMGPAWVESHQRPDWRREPEETHGWSHEGRASDGADFCFEDVFGETEPTEAQPTEPCTEPTEAGAASSTGVVADLVSRHAREILMEWS